MPKIEIYYSPRGEIEVVNRSICRYADQVELRDETGSRPLRRLTLARLAAIEAASSDPRLTDGQRTAAANLLAEIRRILQEISMVAPPPPPAADGLGLPLWVLPGGSPSRPSRLLIHGGFL